LFQAVEGITRFALITATCSWALCAAYAAADVQQLIAQADAEVQSQIKKTYDTMRRLGVISYDNVEVFREAQKVKELVADEDEIVRQLAVFVATTESSEDTHVLLSLMIWRYLQVSPAATIRILAPYLDASDDSLRGFAREWLSGHDDYEDYKKYVRWQVSRDEAVPAPLIKLLYERSPGQALQVFRSGSVDVRAHVQAAIAQLEATGQELEDLEPTPQEQEESERKELKGREILLAEHIVSNALWLHRHKYEERLQEALPEAMAELEKLAKHEQWWARLYVVYIMRQNSVLLQDHILRKLAEDENELVSKAAERRAAPNPGDGKQAKPPVAPSEVNARALGPTSGEVTWQASVGATSYKVLRRQPDTETEYKVIAPNVTGTSFIDTGLAKDTLYQYRVIAQKNP
jgi:hypothetical protein